MTTLSLEKQFITEFSKQFDTCQRDVPVNIGVTDTIDILIDTDVYTCKIINEWYCALGQILSYKEVYPTRKSHIVLFGSNDQLHINVKSIVKICNKYNVNLLFYTTRIDKSGLSINKISCEQVSQTKIIPIIPTVVTKILPSVNNIQEFEHEKPLKHRVRKSDFDFIISNIYKEKKKNHIWFINQFAFHVCYYTGVAPGQLIDMTYENIVDFIHGKFVSIGNVYPLFTNDFVKDKISFLIPYIPLLLQGGMVNTDGGKLDPRLLRKWVGVYLHQLGMKNFGIKDSYRLHDFKTTFLYMLYNSGMNLSDISKYMHHKTVGITENYIKNHPLI